MTNSQKAQIAIEAAAATIADKLVSSGMSAEEAAEYVKSHTDEIITYAVKLINSHKF